MTVRTTRATREDGQAAMHVTIIGAPSSAGAYAPGQEKAPAAFRRQGLLESLRRTGISVTDAGDVPGFRWRPDPARPKAMNLEAVRLTALAVSQHVAEALRANSALLVLGGDCTVELGTVAGAERDGASVGLVYIDLDVDLNPPEQSDGALDWTGVAHLLDLPGGAPELAGLGERRPMLGAKDVLFFAADFITEAEANTIARLQLAQISLTEVKADPIRSAERAVQWAAGFDRLLVHLDVDVLSYVDFPIAENVRRARGLTLDELARALNVILMAPNWQALTVTEVNPDHAPDEREIFTRLIATLTTAIARTA
jgi:arginase